MAIRGSDVLVSRFYYIPWPIYPDYVYPKGVEKVFFKSQDGTVLNGWFFHGKSKLAGERPVLLYVHGNAGNMAAQFFQFSFLMDWGYDVFTFDYRGFGFSKGCPTRKGLWMDTQAAFEEMTKLHPGRKYAVVGFSMGSPYALQLATHEPRVYAAAFLTCFSSFRDIGIYTLRTWGFPNWAARTIGWTLIPNGLDAQTAVDPPRRTLLYTPSRRSEYFDDPNRVDWPPPALFVQGTRDGNIPYAMTEEVASKYEGKHTFLPMPDYPHGDYFKGPLGETFHRIFDRYFSGKEKIS